jgi:serine phosphatase RsbU (regulator of sigma subunit)
LNCRQVYIFLLLFSLGTTALFAQNKKLDSLRGVWEDVNQADSARMPALAQLIWSGYVYSDQDSAYSLTKELSQLAKKNNHPKMMIVSANTFGAIKSLTGDYDSAMHYFKECELISRQTDHKEDQATALMNIGNVHRMKGNLAEAIINYNSARKIYESLDKIDRVLQLYTNISLVYSDQKDFDMAQEYLKKGEKLIQEGHGNDEVALYNYYNLAVNYNNRELPDSAIIYLEKTKSIAESTNNEIMLLHTYVSMGAAYRSVDDNIALDYLYTSLEKGKELNDLQSLSSTYYNMADIFLKQGKINLAIEHAQLSLNYAENIEMLFNMHESAQILYEAYKAKGDSKNALKYYEKFIMYKDSLESEENQRETINQEFKVEYEKKAAADSVKAAEQSKIQAALLEAEKLENQKRKQQSYFLIAGLVIALLFGIIIFNRFKITNRQKVIIETQKEEVDLAYQSLDEKNKEIIDSITYAKRIQQAILPPDKIMEENLAQSFVFYLPKDIVAGDFYWLEKVKDTTLVAAADCTGHGVPGAMVSVICNNGLNRSVREHNILEPGKILDKTREIVVKEFEKSEEDVKDGMDIALCSLRTLNENEVELKYAGAHNPLWIVRKGSNEIEEIKANKQPIGQFVNPEPYTTHTIKLQKDDVFYIFSDGYADQFGGEKGKKFKSTNFKKLLLSLKDLPMNEQLSSLEKSFEEWKGSFEQLDDLCVIGVRV